ncbi:glycosyltransferase [Candidatus Marinimicrobia bacterium]|nr:glycosyltransferase [Candidatus Neomarinimicrobiota bacterium]
MNSDYKVSIVVICYNQEDYIEETLNSLINQKTDFNFQLIVSDDSSTDSTLDKCLKLKNKFPNKIKVLSNSNNIGMVKNAISAWSACDTEFIAFCEGDDYWIDEEKLQKQVQFLQNNESYGMIFTDSNALEVRSGNIIEKYFSKKNKMKDGIISNELILQSFVPTLTVCYRTKYIKSFLDEINPIERSWKMLDTPLAIYVSYHSLAKYDPYSSAVYRIHQESSSSFQDFDKKIDFLLSKINMKIFFLKKFNAEEYMYVKVLSQSLLSFISIIYNHGFPKQSSKVKAFTFLIMESLKQVFKKVTRMQ